MLKTRFYKPKINSSIVFRKRIVNLLNHTSDKALILVVAPAGYGKSIAVSQWLGIQKKTYSWLSLDKGLNDFTVFLDYFTSALSILHPSLETIFKGFVQASSVLSPDAIAERVCNELIVMEEPEILVLDDYYYINNPSIHQFINYLLKFHQISLQIVIISRHYPPLDLKRHRLYGNLTEVRVADLVFDTQEFQLLLEHHKRVFDKNAYLILERSEGWILGISILLKINLIEGRDWEHLTAGNMFLDMDFLIGEYLPLLPEGFCEPLLLAGICDRFNEELLEELFKNHLKHSVNVREFISKLKKYNMFLIPEDDSDQWFRFHHLFSNVLRRRQNNSTHRNIGDVLQFISNWFASRGYIEEAIEYVIRNEDFDAAVDLVTAHRIEAYNKGQWWRVKSWLDQLPDELIKANPTLLLAQIWVLENLWNRMQVHHALFLMESLITEDMGDLIKAEFYFHLSFHELFSNSAPEKALKYAEKSKALYAENKMLGARREMVIAFCMQMLGKLDDSLEAQYEIEKRHHPGEIMYLRSYSTRLFVMLLSGIFVQAKETASRFLYIAKNTFRYMEAWSIYLMANIEFQRFESPGKLVFLKDAIKHEGEMDWRAYMDNYAGLCLYYLLSNDLDSATDSLRKMEKLQQQINDRIFSMTYISVQMRIHWLLGDQQKALEWATDNMEFEMNGVDPLFSIEVPVLSRIRILITFGNTEQVQHGLNLLELFESLVHSVHNAYHDIDILLLKALACYRSSDQDQFKSNMEKAFEVYNSQKITRPFRELMMVAPYLFGKVKDIPFNLRHIISSNAEPNRKLRVLSKNEDHCFDELTKREQGIVTMARRGFRNKEIADQLNISTATVKSHLTHIYRKLNVQNRTSMIQKLWESDPDIF